MSDGTKYYIQTRTNTLLRHQPSGRDEAYGSAIHAWSATDDVMAFMAGEDSDVEEITEAQARKLAPAAFAG